MTSFRPAPTPKPSSVCEQRGYHGPFINLAKYAEFPEWAGMGDCAVCGTTRQVGREEARRHTMLPDPLAADSDPSLSLPDSG